MSKFNNRNRCAGLTAALLMGLVCASAKAEIVTEQLFETTTLVTGGNINATEFTLTSPGTLVIELTDLKWPALLGALSFSVLDAGAQVLQTFTGNGVADNTWNFSITAPGTFYGAIYAKQAASAQAGMYYANVSYQSVSAVPLPAAGWFLISGIAGLVAFRPKQKLSQI